METNKIYCGDSLQILKTFPDNCVDCCITSPPYWGLRDYQVEGQLGLEKTPEAYVAKMVEVFKEVKRVLKKEGTLWLNLGDSYVSHDTNLDANNRDWSKTNFLSGSVMSAATAQSIVKKSKIGIKSKNLVGIPWRVAFALQADGWYLRQDIVWHKPNPMPESVTDRCTKAHEYIFLLAKSQKYYFDNGAIKEPLKHPKEKRRPVGSKGAWELDGRKQRENGGGVAYDGYPTSRNKRSVWTVTTKPFKGAHFATFPEELIKPCILAGCPKDGIVLDPFSGAGTTCLVSKKLGRNYVGIELNPDYIKMAENRIGSILF